MFVPVLYALRSICAVPRWPAQFPNKGKSPSGINSGVVSQCSTARLAFIQGFQRLRTVAFAGAKKIRSCAAPLC